LQPTSAKQILQILHILKISNFAIQMELMARYDWHLSRFQDFMHLPAVMSRWPARRSRQRTLFPLLLLLTTAAEDLDMTDTLVELV
jgi:hypothetical protein